MLDQLSWQPIEPGDISNIVAIAAQIHAGLPEREEVLAEKTRLFPTGCRKLIQHGALVGYGLSHPWRLNTVPPLDEFLQTLPAGPDCLYIHDIAVLPVGRGQGASTAFLEIVQTQAHAANLAHLAMVSVYGTSRLWSGFGFSVVDDSALTAKLKTYGNTARYMTCPTENFRVA